MHVIHVDNRIQSKTAQQLWPSCQSCINPPYHDVLQHQRRPIKWLRSTLTCWAPCPVALQTVSTGRDCWLKSAGLSQHASEGDEHLLTGWSYQFVFSCVRKFSV